MTDLMHGCANRLVTGSWSKPDVPIGAAISRGHTGIVFHGECARRPVGISVIPGTGPIHGIGNARLYICRHAGAGERPGKLSAKCRFQQTPLLVFAACIGPLVYISAW